MASLTSPDWRGFVGRAPLHTGSVPTSPADPKAGRVLWHPTPAPSAAPASRPAIPSLPPPTAFPSWWPAVPPQITPPPHASRQDAGATSVPPPPTRPAPPRPQAPRPPRPISPRLRCCLQWVVATLPKSQRDEVFVALVETLRFRAASERPCSLESKQPIGRERFGSRGETLVPEGTVRVRQRLDDEVRETLRTLEMRLSRTRRNAYLAMHSARLGQLWRELERRFDIDVLEEIKSALGRCWA